MPPRVKIPTDQIARQSKAAEYVRQADEVLGALIDELETTSENLADHFSTSKHLMRCMRLANDARSQLYQTGIPAYRQVPLFHTGRGE